MKTNKDPRHLDRIRVMQQLFAWAFDPEGKVEERDERLPKTLAIIGKLADIDPEIVEAAPERPLIDVNQIDLAVLRQAIYELIRSKDVPVKVVVDEAVEIGKEFGTDTSGSFINGVLGKVIEKHKLA